MRTPTVTAPAADAQRPQITLDVVHQFTSHEDIICLYALAQPLVSEMQAVIRFQHEMLKRAAKAQRHLLTRIQEREDVRYLLGWGTQSFELLTASVAEITGLPVDKLRDHIIPGSAAIHRENEEGQ